MKNIIKILVILVVLFSSCTDNKENETEKIQKEREAIKKYVDENNITTKPNASGLYYIEKSEGTGVQPQIGSFVTVHYQGRFLNGDIFDSSYGKKPFEFKLGTNQVISGWDEGIMLMKEGGKAQLLIPSELAYGSSGQGPIEGYTPLVFDVELTKVMNQQYISN